MQGGKIRKTMGIRRAAAFQTLTAAAARKQHPCNRLQIYYRSTRPKVWEGAGHESYISTAGVRMTRGEFNLIRIASTVALGLVCSALAFVLFFALIAEIGPVRSTVITYVNPAVALLLGVVLLSEPLTVGVIGGFALVLAGSFLATRRALPEQPPLVAER